MFTTTNLPFVSHLAGGIDLQPVEIGASQWSPVFRREYTEREEALRELRRAEMKAMQLGACNTTTTLLIKKEVCKNLVPTPTCPEVPNFAN